MNLQEIRTQIAQRFDGVLSGSGIKVVLQAGTNTIGKLASNSGVDIGDVDVKSIAAGENHLGSVGGNTALVSSNIVMTVAGAYSTGDYIGTSTAPQFFAGAVRTAGNTGIIKSIIISDKLTTTAVNLELWVFSQTFTAPTDNTAWSISDADAVNCLGVIPIGASKWYAGALNKIYTDDTVSLIIKPTATSLFYALVARGATPAWTSLDLIISLGILLD